MHNVAIYDLYCSPNTTELSNQGG